MIQHLGRPVTFMAAILVLSTAAEAEPVTYAGKLGKSDIVVEFTGDPATADGPLAGRYFYRSKGVDIPLQARLQKGSKFELAEEEACGADNCDDGKAAPIAAVWRLASSSNGKILEGSWNGKKALPLRLERVASRQVTGNEPSTPLDLYDFSFMKFFGNDTPLTMETSPYDYLRMDTQLDNGKTTGWPDATYRYVVDPRTKFATPRIVELSGDVPIEAANALLQERHWRANIGALGCVAAQYAGFNEGGPIDGVNDGTLGGYEDSTFEVTSLTPRLMSWRESGSIFCGGAHPTNYSDAYIMDVRGGVLLGLQDIFSDTVDGKPGPSLVSFVKQRRKKPIDQTDIDHEAECGMDDLIGEYLAVSLWREGDKQVLVFGLQTLPHAIQACADDLLDLAVSEARDLFKPEFARLVEP
ncbi:hypothetical protein NKL07_05950 [Mesorhizobium sp. C280B]|uniref:hypothetical protein n=1 Tax=unclassified Mesorhizobium TaxID=325217 RepID=UPI0003CF86A8|nr:hypothetical protein [Mesorhizobium sp. LSJC280B00]ESW90236.1 hypothetical protein X772_07410 [Mesorhizobium sp. LSJC280B00]